MKRFRSLFSALMLSTTLVVFSGCSTFYYGYSKEQWNAMSPDEQEQAKVEYADVLAEHNKNTFQDPQDEAIEAFKDRTKRKKGVAGPDPI